MKRDVAIVGGGPAGLAAAIALRRKGFDATVMDARHPPIDKACGEGLMPDGREALARLGVDLPDSLGMPFEGIRFVGERSQVTANFPSGMGLGLRRTALHDAMVKIAERSGVRLMWGTPVSRIEDLRATWIIGADGGSSRVRHWAGLDQVVRDRRRVGFRRHYEVEPWATHVELHWGDRCQLYITPVGSKEICVVSISRDPTLRLDRALERFPEVAERLANAPVRSEERGSFTSTCRLRSITKGNIALIGDASGMVDAITGDGLCLAFRQAEALAEALALGDLRSYEGVHGRLRRRPAFMADLMLGMDPNPRFQARALRALESKPRLFENLLALHVGELGFADLARTGIALGWELVTV